ncbi:hypothetical protein LCGC14_3083360 [marine sediment metagenome]|uniref:Uncharacterized protein n=1 Tax=marine sediment metagenome TaxID=412755 RepID=A0A0F8YK87_9ZZZZ
MDIREEIATEIAKISKGYVGITDPLYFEKRRNEALPKANPTSEVEG